MDITFGCGPRTLVVLPGMSLANRPPGRLVSAGYERGFAPLAEDHTVHVVRRPAGLPPDASTRQIAALYGELIAREFGPARVLGLSTGGLIAQWLALDFPELVERLALVVSGARLSIGGRRICEGWLELAAAGRWRRAHGSLAACAVDGGAAQAVARTLLTLLGPTPTEAERADFVTFVHAVLGHDTRTALKDLARPALLIGGATDPFFPPSSLRETPIADLRVYDGVGHGLPKSRASRMLREVGAFLADVQPIRSRLEQ